MGAFSNDDSAHDHWSCPVCQQKNNRITKLESDQTELLRVVRDMTQHVARVINSDEIFGWYSGNPDVWRWERGKALLDKHGWDYEESDMDYFIAQRRKAKEGKT